MTEKDQDGINPGHETVYEAKDFPEKLRELRVSRRESQRDLADAIETHQQNIWRWEKGGGEPTRAQWIALSRHYEMPIEYLLDDECQDPRAREGLTFDESRILEIVRKIGIERAEARLLQIGEPAAREPIAPNVVVVMQDDQIVRKTSTKRNPEGWQKRSFAQRKWRTEKKLRILQAIADLPPDQFAAAAAEMGMTPDEAKSLIAGESEGVEPESSAANDAARTDRDGDKAADLPCSEAEPPADVTVQAIPIEQAPRRRKKTDRGT